MKADRNYLIEKYNATSTETEPGSDELESYESWLEKQLLKRINETKESECCGRCIEGIDDKPKGLIRYEKQKPPKNKVVLFVWWHRNGIETSQKCCGFLTDSGKLITDLKFPKSTEPTYWKELF